MKDFLSIATREMRLDVVTTIEMESGIRFRASANH